MSFSVTAVSLKPSCPTTARATSSFGKLQTVIYLQSDVTSSSWMHLSPLAVSFKRLVRPLHSSAVVQPVQRMKSLEGLKFVNPFTKELPGDKEPRNGVRQVYDAYYSFVDPTPTKTDPQLITYSKEVCALLELDEEETSRPEFAMAMTGQTTLPQTQYYAHCYGGHQFGNWAGQLGDGRAINFGEIVTDEGMKCEIQLKVPTTRALCLVSTGDSVERDMFYNGNVVEELGAVICRVAPSFIRFGSFQLPAMRGGNQLYLIKKLTDWVIKHHYPHHTGGDQYKAFFQEVCEKTGTLVAHWQSIGFVHGVLNTDNMSILGLTIDYGPFGFVDRFDPDFSPNISDIQSGGRYAFRNQPEIGQWNLIRLGDALCRGELMTTDEVEQGVQTYEEVMLSEYTQLMSKKFGLRAYNKELFGQFMKNMYLSKADFTNAFRSLSAISADVTDPSIPAALEDTFRETLNEEQKISWMEWIADYREALLKNGYPMEERTRVQDSVNPKYIPRQHLLQKAIEKAEKGEFGELERLMEILRHPYEEQPNAEEYCRPPTEEMIRPGVCYLSCSS